MGDSYENDQNLKMPGSIPGYTDKDNSADPATKPRDHCPPPPPKSEENAYLHLITYEIQRIANCMEYWTVKDIIAGGNVEASHNISEEQFKENLEKWRPKCLNMINRIKGSTA